MTVIHQIVTLRSVHLQLKISATKERRAQSRGPGLDWGCRSTWLVTLELRTGGRTGVKKCVCVCVRERERERERERKTDRQADRQKDAFQLGKQSVLWPCGRRPREHVEEWEGRCGWSLESERRLRLGRWLDCKRDLPVSWGWRGSLVVGTLWI